MSETPGKVYCELAYAQGKMLDNSGWAAVLPRGITPSDIDFVFDNNGSIIYGELSSSCILWEELATGQRRLYWSLIRGTRHIAVLCRHVVAQDTQIDTRSDVIGFSVMYDCDGKMATQTYRGNSVWQNMVKRWFVNPNKVREKLPPPAPEDDEVDWDNVLRHEREEPPEEPPFLSDALSLFSGEIVPTKKNLLPS